MPLIEKFKINNLHNYYDVELNFKNDNTIYIGENGIGKTTILSILYYLLDLNYEKLLSFIFESIEIKIEGRDLLKISKEDIRQINIDQRDSRRHIPKSVVDDLLTGIQHDEILMGELLELCKTRDSNFDIKVRVLYRKYDLFKKYPFPLVSAAVNEILYKINPEGYVKVINEIENVKNKYKILYFPTYRRIEEDLRKLNISPKNMGPGEDILNSKFSGELIHFGMKDVEQRIEELLNKISKETNESYNNMTSGLLNTFANREEIQASDKDFNSPIVKSSATKLFL